MKLFWIVVRIVFTVLILVIAPLILDKYEINPSGFGGTVATWVAAIILTACLKPSWLRSLLKPL
jgi:hypothetical protein